jgi:carboxylesterase type B
VAPPSAPANLSPHAAKRAQEHLPVIVWIYGGGYINGSASMPLYWGDRLAHKGVIVVTIAYRLGPLGFLAHPELTRESPHRSFGNYGLMDLIAALEWIQRNIAAFGGDPRCVTIAGQSAGAMLVSMLMASPLAKGLFQRAIGESGCPRRNTKPYTRDSNFHCWRGTQRRSAGTKKRLTPQSSDESFRSFRRGNSLGYYRC